MSECKRIHAEETARKSEVATMPIFMKDEKYAEVVDVLYQLEKWTHEIYTAAGLCSPNAESSDDTTPTTGTTSRPDQPASHFPPFTSYCVPFRGVKVPCFGDQLTGVRFAEARDLRAGCQSAKKRLDHLYPIRIVDWHTKRSFLKVLYDIYMISLYLSRQLSG